MSVEVIMDAAAEKFFAARAMAVGLALEAMAGVKDANLTVSRAKTAGDVELYAMNAACEASSLPIAIAAMQETLKTMSDGLMHEIKRAPIAEEEKDFLTDEIHYMGYVRAEISNQAGGQRVPYGSIKATGPDVV